MKLGIPVYEGVNLLDVAGPYEMFNWVPPEKGLKTVVVSADGCPVTTLNGLRFDAHASFAETPALDVLWVPGGDPAALGDHHVGPRFTVSRVPVRRGGGREMGVLGVRGGAPPRTRRTARRSQGDDALGVCASVSRVFPGSTSTPRTSGSWCPAIA